jgi:hypothetical protein
MFFFIETLRLLQRFFLHSNLFSIVLMSVQLFATSAMICLLKRCDFCDVSFRIRICHFVPEFRAADYSSVSLNCCLQQGETRRGGTNSKEEEAPGRILVKETARARSRTNIPCIHSSRLDP